MGKQLLLAILCCELASCAAADAPPKMRASGELTLPPGETELHEPLVVPEGAADLVIQGQISEQLFPDGLGKLDYFGRIGLVCP